MTSQAQKATASKVTFMGIVRVRSPTPENCFFPTHKGKDRKSFSQKKTFCPLDIFYKFREDDRIENATIKQGS